MAIVRNIEEEDNKTILTVDESNVVANGIVTCGAQYTYDKNLSQQQHGKMEMYTQVVHG